MAKSFAGPSATQRREVASETFNFDAESSIRMGLVLSGAVIYRYEDIARSARARHAPRTTARRALGFPAQRGGAIREARERQQEIQKEREESKLGNAQLRRRGTNPTWCACVPRTLAFAPHRRGQMQCDQTIPLRYTLPLAVGVGVQSSRGCVAQTHCPPVDPALNSTAMGNRGGGPNAFAYRRPEIPRSRNRPISPNIRGCENPSSPEHRRPPNGLNYCAHGRCVAHRRNPSVSYQGEKRRLTLVRSEKKKRPGAL